MRYLAASPQSRTQLASSVSKCTFRTIFSASAVRHTASFNHFVSRKIDDAPAVDQSSSTPKKFRLAVKDNIATAGNLPTQCASWILAAHASPFEATIVKQLRVRGAQVVGKTNMDEFGMGSHSTNSAHGAVISPHLVAPSSSSSSEEQQQLLLQQPPAPADAADAVSAGGSSGGSAVAVYLGDADLALGTDTGGSVRLPAAYTGVVGYKPSYGMLSRFGVVPYANSLDTVGLLARDVAAIQDVVFATALHMEHDENDPTSLRPATRTRCAAALPADLAPLHRVTVGIPTEYNIVELEPAVRAAWVAAADLLEAHDVRIVAVSLPSTREALCAYYVLAPAEASSNLAKYDGVRYGVRYGVRDSNSNSNSNSNSGDGDGSGSGSGSGSDSDSGTLYSETRGAGFGDEVKRRILLGTYSLSSAAMDNYFVQAQRVRRRVQLDFDRVFGRQNPLREPRQFDLCDLSPGAELEDKRGPAQVDFLLCPTAPSFAPRLRDVEAARSSVDAYTNDVFTVPASLAGLPAVSVPMWPAQSSLPVGMQLVAQFWDDERLVSMARKLQEMVGT